MLACAHVGQGLPDNKGGVCPCLVAGALSRPGGLAPWGPAPLGWHSHEHGCLEMDSHASVASAACPAAGDPNLSIPAQLDTLRSCNLHIWTTVQAAIARSHSGLTKNCGKHFIWSYCNNAA